MKKTSVLIFAAGAVAGWAAAQKTLSEANSWDKGLELSNDWQPPAIDTQPSEFQTEPTHITTKDPFRAAFQGAQAEVDAHTRLAEEPDKDVA